MCVCGSEQEAIEKTASTSRLSRVKLHRGRAILSKDRKQTTPATSECLFVQGARALNAKPSAYLRVPLDQQKEYLFPVGFVVFNSRGQDEDEAGLDWGGLYREAMNTMVDDLFDPDVLNLFIRVPNAASHAGGNQDTFVPNPKYNSPHAMQLFEFVGKLMGIAMRTRNFMPFRFPSIVWKPLVGQPVSREDLEGVDKVFYHYISNVMSSVANNDGTKYYFTVPRSDSVFVPLRSGGHRELVTADNVNEYIALAQRYRLREFKSQVGAMLHGLSQLVPARALRVLSWSELETQVCGVREVNLRLMKKHTHYVVYKETDAVVKVCTATPGACVRSPLLDSPRTVFVCHSASGRCWKASPPTSACCSSSSVGDGHAYLPLAAGATRASSSCPNASSKAPTTRRCPWHTLASSKSSCLRTATRLSCESAC